MKLKALVIDDSSIMRKMVINHLRATKLADFDFVEAEDGADGLEKFDPARTDIVFVDWNMPNMTGIEFVRRARATAKADHIPIIMVTSERKMGKIEQALGTGKGATDYICKPFTAAQLRMKVSRLVDDIAAHRAHHEGKGAGDFFSRLLGGES